MMRAEETRAAAAALYVLRMGVISSKKKNLPSTDFNPIPRAHFFPSR